MRHSKKLLALLLAAALALGMLAGCGEEPAAESAPAQSEEPAAVESEAPPSEEPAEEGTRVLTDMAGREVELPAVIERRFPRTRRRQSSSTRWCRTGCWAGTTS